ncbi:MAG: hypothetical protein GY866_34540 [Proteobacteria bacterium]|nr:hypothetical protein [Pseudomonadota bacterium]
MTLKKPNSYHLAEVHEKTDKVVCGGIPQWDVLKMSFDELIAIAEESIANMKDRVMPTGGCGILIPLLEPDKRRMLREVAETIRF